MYEIHYIASLVDYTTIVSPSLLAGSVEILPFICSADNGLDLIELTNDQPILTLQLGQSTDFSLDLVPSVVQ